jgi:uncharacterized membrane protein
MGLDQMGLVPSTWEPFFGDGSERVLHSSFSRALPIPDALLGAMAYAAELGALLMVASDRDDLAWKRLVYGGLAAAMAAGSAALVLLQAFVVRSWCTLCLASAFVSFVVFALAVPELVRGVRHVETRHSFS